MEELETQLETLQVLEPPEPPDVLPPLDTVLTEREEREVRDELRRQIARMEGELGRLFATAFPDGEVEWTVGSSGWGPRVLGIEELEEARDDLADRLAGVRRQLAEIAESQEAQRQLLERMLADPSAYPGVTVTARSMGQPSCARWRSMPGIFGKWWRITLSSGCPLAGGRGVCRGPEELQNMLGGVRVGWAASALAAFVAHLTVLCDVK